MRNFFTKQKAVIYLNMAFMFLGVVTNAQIGTSAWKFSNPTQFGFTVLDVSFIDNNNGIAVGYNGGIAKTTDAGVNWKYAAFTFTDADGMIQSGDFNTVHFVTPTIAYAVGNRGLLAKSTDAGLNWTAINNPLFPEAKTIYGLYFINKDTGYIGGQAVGTDLAPKLYFTKNGGATWDSLAAPLGPKTRIGYVANPTMPPVITDVNAGEKEIHRIMFVNDSIGYVTGSGATYVPYTTDQGETWYTGGAAACLVWKFNKGVLTDYSISKERTGYEGIAYLPVDDQTTYNPLDPAQQTIKAVHAFNDSSILIATFNNNIVIKISTGKNDSTENIAVPGTYDRGKYEMLNYPYPPLGAPSIPVDQVLFSANYITMKSATDGTIFMNSGEGNLASTKDSGRTWTIQKVLPTGTYHSENNLYALDITPNGKIYAMGANGVAVDSSSGTPWKSSSNYNSVTLNGSYSRVEFLDCNNGVLVGGGQITTTTDAGKTWIDKVRQDFVNNYVSINGMSYADPAKLILGTSVGTIYTSPDQGTTLDPLFQDPYFYPDWGIGGMITDLASVSDRIWAFGFRYGASERTMLFRSLDNGATWDTIKAWPLDDLAPMINRVKFSTQNIGYAAGDKGKIYKTTDGGATWTDISPDPVLNEFVSYADISLLDNNTIFAIGNGYPRQVVYKSTNGGTTWTEITPTNSNIFIGYYNAILMHDVNNGYILLGGAMLVTNDGGVTWRADFSPTGGLMYSAAFVNKNVPVGTPMANRKVMIGTLTFGFGNTPGGHIMEYGDPALSNVSSTEALTGSCANGANGIVVVTATGGIAPYTYSIDGTTFQTSNTFTGLTAGNKNIIIKDAGCQTVTKSVTVALLPNPVVSAGPDKTILDGVEVQLSGSGSSNVTSIAWTPAASLVAANTYTPYAKPTITTNYTLTVQDANNCISTDNTLVTVIPYCVKVMTAFTPNGDGINDKWLVTSGISCTNQVIARVFNRYGTDVFTSDTYNNDWDGTYKGKPVPDGTYYYVVNYKLISGRVVQVTGNVTILR